MEQNNVRQEQTGAENAGDMTSEPEQIHTDRRRKMRRLSDEQISHTFHQLSMLLGAGVTPLDGIDIMIRDRDNTDLTATYSMLKDNLLKGMRLSEAMQETGVFPNYAVRILNIGEQAGTGDRVCASLSRFYEEQDSLRSSVRDAFLYPFVMIVMMFFLVIIMLSSVMPIFEQVFQQLGTSVTGVARILMRISETLSRSYSVLIIIFAALAALFFYCYGTIRGRAQFRAFLLAFRPTRPFMEQIAVSRFASAMQLTGESGMSAFEQLSLSRSIVENPDVETKIDRCTEELREGNTLADALSSSGLFSSFYSSMINVASLTGNVDIVMGYIARHYREDTSHRIDSILSRIEPVMVAVLAVIIGLILLSVILPLMGVMTSIG